MNTLTINNQKRRVAIIGGGISGLSAAWYMEKAAESEGVDLDYTVLEKSSRWGGKVLTESVNEFVVEAGPDSFLTQKPWALQLAHELGMDDEMIGTNDSMRHVFVLKNGRPVILPDGVLLIVPTKFMPFALSPLISPVGKLRMGLDWFIPARKDDCDETLASFIKRRLGHEALDRIAEPLMSGIYNADANKQSLLATFPRFRAIEQKHSSLIRGMLAARRQRKSTSTSDRKPVSTFMSFRGGSAALINRLLENLKGDLRLQTSVEAIEQHLSGRYTLHLSTGGTVEADAMIFATPAFVTANLLQHIAPDATDNMAKIHYVSTGTISLAFRKHDISSLLPGFGLVVPQSENRPINAITISSTKFDHRAPDDAVLMRVFFGGARSPESMHFDDTALLQMVRAQLQELMGIDAEPIFHKIYRWWNANPQYDLGHLELVESIESALPEGIYVTGNAYRGVGMPDCVHQSQQTAKSVISALRERVRV